MDRRTWYIVTRLKARVERRAMAQEKESHSIRRKEKKKNGKGRKERDTVPQASWTWILIQNEYMSDGMTVLTGTPWACREP
jgi:hypothetical protein